MEQILKQKIEQLEKEIAELKKQNVATHKNGTVKVGAWDGELGTSVPVEKEGLIPLTPEEMAKNAKRKELRLYELMNELRLAQEQLEQLELKQSQADEERLLKENIRKQTEESERIKAERIENNQPYKDLDILVKCLSCIGMDDLAELLSKMRYAYQNLKGNYIQKEIELQMDEKANNTGVAVTRKDYIQIKRSVAKLSKEATRMAKKYIDVYKLFSSAYELIDDMIDKKIINSQGEIIDYNKLDNYFNKPEEKYFHKVSGVYKFAVEPNLGYQFLEFYRNVNSKYNIDFGDLNR